MQVTFGEDGANWLAFFRDLTASGVTGVKRLETRGPAGPAWYPDRS